MHPSEDERLEALVGLGLLDSAPEERFDRLTRLAATLLDAPIALLTLVDRDRQWFKSRVGIDAVETARGTGFCAHAIVGEGATMVVSDATADPRFADAPFVTGGPQVRFYAGRVLAGPDGLPLGTLCVMDRRPRELTTEQAQSLADLGALAEQELLHETIVTKAIVSEGAAQTSLDLLEQGVMLVAPGAIIRRLNPAAERLLGSTAEKLTELWATGHWLAYDEEWEPLVGDARPLVRAAKGHPVDGEVVGWLRSDGERLLLRVSCVQNADGNGGLLVTLTDVTEERRMLRDLARFRHLFQNADDMIAIVDATGHVQYASPSTARVLGYPAGWHHPDGVLGLVHPDDAPAAIRELELLVAGDREPEPVTVRLRACSGEWRHVECVGVNLLDEPTVQGLVLTFRDTTDRERLTAQLAHMASHDPLTDLPNRSVLEPRLGQALSRTARSGQHIGLCFIDLDRFKAVNDVHGHAAGDDVLVDVAQRIRAVVRNEDTAVRIGGDEFVVILDPVAGPADALEAALRIRDALVEPPLQGGLHAVGASVGVAVSEPGEGPAALLQRADAALYRAKANRNSAVELAWTSSGALLPTS